MSKLTYYEKMYLEELEFIEQEIQKYPLEKAYIEEWKLVAELITQLQIAQEYEEMKQWIG